jgi:UDP-2,4-diacetamido-2,4,6-trideoxy-beta-L-altropyranose hydrolase
LRRLIYSYENIEMNIVIRTDASVHISSGHVMRCLVLANALRKNGHNVSFITRVQEGDMVDHIYQQSFKVMKLESPLSPLVPQNNSDYSAWLQVSERDDASNSIALIQSADLVIIDHYGINTLWEQQIKKQLQCYIMAIDDLVRLHNADLILDQTYSRKASEYVSTTKNVLAGCQYALLAPRFSELRQQASLKRLNVASPKVLISMGGIDNPNASLKVLQCLELLRLKPSVTVLLGMRSPHYEKLKAFCQTRREWITHVEFTYSMPELMLEHDLSIGAPGSTSWERACLGLPSIVIPLAENQQQICSALESVGAALRVELNNIKDELLPAYHHILGNWITYQKINFSLCDGLGAQRVVQRIEKLFQ